MFFKNILIILFLLYLSGCATYEQQLTRTYQNIENENYNQAEIELQKKFEYSSSDRVLYYMELGILKHLSGEYKESNRNLELAEREIENLYTKSISEEILVGTTNENLSTYKGTDYENLLINYYKSLNYLKIYQNNKHNISLLDSSLVEIRRIDFKLNKLRNEKGSLKENKESDFLNILSFFNKVLGDYTNKEKLIYSESAYSHYYSGIIYEQSSDWDNARIAYEKAAKSYENGYANQVGIGNQMAERAWLDVIRMKYKSGDPQYKLLDIMDEKLSKKSINLFEKYKNNSYGEMVLINHVGYVERKDEMNFVAKIDQKNQELIMYPVLNSKSSFSSDKYKWFWMMYADKGIFDLIERYHRNSLNDIPKTFIQKRVPLYPLWNLVNSLDLDDVLKDGGIRVAVPYYRTPKKIYKTQLVLNKNKKIRSIRADSISSLAINEQILNARSDLYMALSREIIKNYAFVKTMDAVDNPFLNIGIKALVATTAKSDTRNWSLLPSEIQIIRFPLSEGTHHISVRKGSQSLIKNVNIKRNDIIILKERFY